MLSKEQEYFISDLNPRFQDIFRRFIKLIEANGYGVIVTSGYRTFAKQAQLKKENPKNASPGSSMHNFGMAIDLNLFQWKEGKKMLITSKSTKQEWIATGVPNIAQSLGLTWGGNFGTYYDPVHFGFDGKFDTKRLLAQAQNQFKTTDPAKIRGNELLLA